MTGRPKSAPPQTPSCGLKLAPFDGPRKMQENGCLRFENGRRQGGEKARFVIFSRGGSRSACSLSLVAASRKVALGRQTQSHRNLHTLNESTPDHGHCWSTRGDLEYGAVAAPVVAPLQIPMGSKSGPSGASFGHRPRAPHAAATRKPPWRVG